VLSINATAFSNPSQVGQRVCISDPHEQIEDILLYVHDNEGNRETLSVFLPNGWAILAN